MTALPSPPSAAYVAPAVVSSIITWALESVDYRQESYPRSVVEALPPGLQDAVQRLPSLIEETLARSGVPGLAVAVVHGGTTVYSAGFGVKTVGATDLIGPETVFLLAALPEPAGVAEPAEAVGPTMTAAKACPPVIGWDPRSLSELPSFAVSGRGLTSHDTEHETVGGACSHPTWLRKAAGDLLKDLGTNRGAVLSHLRYEALDPFRIGSEYADFRLTSGAEAAAAAASTDSVTLSQWAPHRPSGMASTSSRYRDYLGRADRATSHAFVDGRFQPRDERTADDQTCAGAVSSNVDDLARWMALVLGSGVVGPAQHITATDRLAATSRPIVSSRAWDGATGEGTYGYGFSLGTQAGGPTTPHRSGGFTCGTAVMIIPSADVGIVVLTNGAPVGAAETVATTFSDIMAFGSPTRDWCSLFSTTLASSLATEGGLVPSKTLEDFDEHGLHTCNR